MNCVPKTEPARCEWKRVVRQSTGTTAQHEKQNTANQSQKSKTAFLTISLTTPRRT
jgi:hypothetical protein